MEMCDPRWWADVPTEAALLLLQRMQWWAETLRRPEDVTVAETIVAAGRSALALRL